ncbi:MAG: 2-dehydropantoate 2-reductase [Deltaproteobacteria bacterium]|nr:2-dehydropantoate 2-reductase [Deltaproteobacteria bacterium]
MRIAVVGTGGVGGYFGGRLAQAGHDVAFVARGKHLAAMQADGLTVESVAGDFQVHPVRAHERPEDIGPVDVVLVCVKAWQVVEVSELLAPLLGPSTFVVPLQNGVEAPDQIAARVGRDRLMVGIARIISFVAAPGRIRHAGAEPAIELGELDRSRSARLEQLVGAFRECTAVTCQAVEDVEAAMWTKFLFVAGWGSVAAIARAPVGAIRQTPVTRALVRESMGEIDALARARGVALASDAVDRAIAYADQLPFEGTTSLQRDIQAGLPSEIEAWSGAVVRLSQAANLPCHVHRIAYAAVQPLEQRARGMLTF